MSKRRPIDAVSDGEEEENPRNKRARVVNQDEGMDVDETTAPAPSALSKGKRRKARDEDGDDDDDEIDEDEDARLEAEQGARIRAAIENKGKSHGVRHSVLPPFLLSLVRRSDRYQGVADHGIIESLEMAQFMCHKFLDFKFGPQINFIIGTWASVSLRQSV
jgi:structural maintenance of chromosomes protein 6